MRNRFPALLSIALLSSCIEPIRIESDENLPVVVQCVLKHESEQTLRLYHMRSLYSKENKPVDDARVFIIGIEPDTGIRDTVEFSRGADGVEWKAVMCPGFNTKYELLVRVPGREDITATTRFPEDLRLVMHFREIHEGKGMNGDLPDSSYYRAYTAEVHHATVAENWEYGDAPRYYKSYEEVSKKACKMWICPHVDSTAWHWTYGYFRAFLSPEDRDFHGCRQPYVKYAVTDHPGADDFNVVPGVVSDLEWTDQMSSAFMTIPGRINKWFQYSISRWIKFMCPDLPLHDRFLRIDHPADFNNGVYGEGTRKSYQFSSSSFLICGDYSIEYPKAREAASTPLDYIECTNEVHFVSDEYDSYLRGLYVKYKNRNDFVLSTYETSNVYSNINGGVGIFGADYATWDEVDVRNRNNPDETVLL